MTLDEVTKHIQACAKLMNEHYGRVVFDEWAVVSLRRHDPRVLSYRGPRSDDFLKNFVTDLGGLRADLLNSKYQAGDFEFSHQGVGTGIEAFLVLGNGAYLICNNTQASMTDIVRDPRWLAAQVPFAELSDRVRNSPLRVGEPAAC